MAPSTITPRKQQNQQILSGIHYQIPAMIQEGDRVPDFELPSQTGEVVRSSEMAGNRYIVYFYPRDFTPGCTTEADEFTKAYGVFEKAGIRILGVSPDTTESHQKFCSKMSIPYPLLADTDKALANAFGVWGPKKFMGREYMGVNRSTFLVDESGTVFKVFAKVKPKGHARQVLESFTK
jgi:peroxiredoxin Q/BCP